MAKIRTAANLILTLVSFLSLLAFCPKIVEADALEWSVVSIPSNGLGNQWIIAGGSDLNCLTQDSNGTLYCYANPSSTPFRLFKSIDGGNNWSYTGRVEDNIIDIAILPNDPNQVYYATTSRIYRSIDAADNFELLAAGPGGSGNGNVEIVSLDVSSSDTSTYVAIGLRDKDNLQFGGVYLLNENQPSSWQNCQIGSNDIFKVAFSPNFVEDGQLIAIGTDEIDTFVSSGTTAGDWGMDTGEAKIQGIVPISADISFPDDYDSTVTDGKYIQYICLNTGSGLGGVFYLRGREAPSPSVITRLNIDGSVNRDISCLGVVGSLKSTKLLAGSADSSLIFYSEDAGKTWHSSTKSPTGDAVTGILMSADFSASGEANAITRGSESAFSQTQDDGVTWNQEGLIDTRISAILDLAVSPNYSQDSRLFLLTADVQNSLWYSSDSGDDWQRIYCTTPSNPERIKMLLLSPQYSENQTVLLAGTNAENPIVLKSTDNGKVFTRSLSIDPYTGDPVNIDCWAITSSDVLIVGSFDGSRGIVYHTGPGSVSYIEKGVAGNQALVSLVVSPDFNTDHSLMAGNSSGSVFFSSDNGLVFEALPFDSTEPPFSGLVNPAFDANYAQSKIVYAASSTTGSGIYRLDIEDNLSWESIDASLPVGAKIGPILISQGGALYALNTQPISNSESQGGIERSLNPAIQAPVFETLTRGTEDGTTLKKLWMRENTLWTVDSSHNQLLTLEDRLVSPITLVSPANGASGMNDANTTLTWTPIDGVMEYHWQISSTADFSILPAKFEGDTTFSSVTLNVLDPNTTYFWRMKASQPVSSPWSTVWTFNTLKIDAPNLSQPSSSGTCSIEPVFRWNASEGAAEYELLVSLNDSFSPLVINRLCNTNVWQSDVTLNYDTTYYWKVRAKKGVVTSAWSAVGLFKTEAEPAPTPELEAPALSQPRFDSVSSVTPIFRWSTSDGADQYILQVSTSEVLSDPVINKICSSNFGEGDSALDYSTRYYWRVSATNASTQSAWSDIFVFTTEPEPVPELETPTLVKPKTGSACPINPVFEWNASTGAEKYDLQVSHYDNFTHPAIDKSGDSACNSNVWACEIALEYDTTYYWRVRAANTQTISNWSEVGLFITESAQAPTPTPGLAAPRPSSPVSSTSASILPVFKWSSVEGADQYQIEVSTSDNFSSLFIDEICYANAWGCNKTLAYNTTYYWKVRARSGETTSNWSDVNAFTTKNQSSGSSSGGSGGSSRTPSPVTTPTFTPTSTPTPTPSTTPIPAPVSTVTTPPSIIPSTVPSPVSSQVALLTTPFQHSNSLTSQPPAIPSSTGIPSKTPGDSTVSWLFLLVGGLGVLTVITTGTLIFILKRGDKSH